MLYKAMGDWFMETEMAWSSKVPSDMFEVSMGVKGTES